MSIDYSAVTPEKPHKWDLEERVTCTFVCTPWRPRIRPRSRTPDSGRSTCSSAIAKMTKIIYQRGIDVSKHGSSDHKIPAIEVLMRDKDNAYVLSVIHGVGLGSDHEQLRVRLVELNLVHESDVVVKLGRRRGLAQERAYDHVHDRGDRQDHAHGPGVVRCCWRPINVANLCAFVMTHEELDRVKGCDAHKNCKGHLRTNLDGSAYMIPSGFATSDELRESDSHVFNRMLMNARKDAQDIMNFCFDKISSKNGIMRKMCNGSRPTNTCRFVVSPSSGPMNTVYLPFTVFDKGVFLYMNPDGRCSTRRLAVGDNRPEGDDW